MRSLGTSFPPKSLGTLTNHSLAPTKFPKNIPTILKRLYLLWTKFTSFHLLCGRFLYSLQKDINPLIFKTVDALVFKLSEWTLPYSEIAWSLYIHALFDIIVLLQSPPKCVLSAISRLTMYPLEKLWKGKLISSSVLFFKDLTTWGLCYGCRPQVL